MRCCRVDRFVGCWPFLVFRCEKRRVYRVVFLCECECQWERACVCVPVCFAGVCQTLAPASNVQINITYTHTHTNRGKQTHREEQGCRAVRLKTSTGATARCMWKWLKHTQTHTHTNVSTRASQGPRNGMAKANAIHINNANLLRSDKSICKAANCRFAEQRTCLLPCALFAPKFKQIAPMCVEWVLMLVAHLKALCRVPQFN